MSMILPSLFGSKRPDETEILRIEGTTMTFIHCIGISACLLGSAVSVSASQTSEMTNEIMTTCDHRARANGLTGQAYMDSVSECVQRIAPGHPHIGSMGDGSSGGSISYKCKDQSGQWTATACTGKLAPPAAPPVFEPIEPHVGMTAEQVKTRTSSRWNQPTNINRTTTAGHEREQWVYQMGYRHDYLYFQDGILISIQENE